jgi:serine protease AprX
LASNAELVLIQVLRTGAGKINNAGILRGLRWLIKNAQTFHVRVLNISLGGDRVAPHIKNPIDAAIQNLIDQGVAVVTAAGNEGQRYLVPPATAPMAITVGGIDDKNLFDRAEIELWHSNYGETIAGAQKPELVAPSIWVAAPMLPETPTANEAAELFAKRAAGDHSSEVSQRMAAQKLISPFYQHVDGTSFAAPLTSSTIACALQANPNLTPKRIRALMRASAKRVEGAPVERQGAGVLDAGQAIALVVWDRHDQLIDRQLPPLIRQEGILFFFHDPDAKKVEVLGSWNDWQTPAVEMVHVEHGVWKGVLAPLPSGHYKYKFLIDGNKWMDDPANPHKAPDPHGIFNSILIVP